MQIRGCSSSVSVVSVLSCDAPRVFGRNEHPKWPLCSVYLSSNTLQVTRPIYHESAPHASWGGFSTPTELYDALDSDASTGSVNYTVLVPPSTLLEDLQDSLDQGHSSAAQVLDTLLLHILPGRFTADFIRNSAASIGNG